jgi:hypothetical protein
MKSLGQRELADGSRLRASFANPQDTLKVGLDQIRVQLGREGAQPFPI